MIKQMDTPGGRSTWMKVVGLILALLWALFWVWFGLASALSEGLNLGGTIMHTSIPGVVFLISVFVVWWFQRVGAVILLIEGIAIAIAYPIMVSGTFPVSTILLVEATMALPPLLAGILLLFDYRKRAFRQNSQQ